MPILKYHKIIEALLQALKKAKLVDYQVKFGGVLGELNSIIGEANKKINSISNEITQKQNEIRNLQATLSSLVI